jgi:short-subunit dehydrogenase
MGVSLKPVSQQVIVITGASSGIGLATARMAAGRGAKLVIAARNGEALERIAQELRAQGGEVHTVVTDVSRREDIERIAQEAVSRFGGFDTWVNNAATSIYGRLEQISQEDHRRLFDINFWGLVNGSLVAVRHLRERGGAVINLGSVVSDVAVPLQGMYAASKHAVKGFTDSLRMELEEEGAPVSVTLIKPGSIDTPFPQNARNYMAQEPKLPPPVYPPEDVARAILHAASHRKRDIFVGGAAKTMSMMERQAPRAFDRIASRIMTREQKRNERARDPEGALWHAGGGGRSHGDHPGHVASTSLYTRAALNPGLTAGVVALGALAVAVAVGGTRGEQNGRRRR